MAIATPVRASKTSCCATSAGASSPPKGTMDPQLWADLVAMGLSHFAGSLLEEGIERTSDLDYLQDTELEHMGMKRVHVRKLRDIAANANVKIATVEPPLQAIEAPTHLRLRVELILERASMAKKMGNQLLKAGDNQGSANMYKNGIDMVLPLIPLAFTSSELQTIIMDVYFALRINAAHCCYKQNDYHTCIHHAQKVLELKPTSAPALYRRGQARAMLNTLIDLQWACCDFERVVMLDPTNHCARHQLMNCKARLPDYMQQMASNTAAAFQETKGVNGWQIEQVKQLGETHKVDMSKLKPKSPRSEDEVLSPTKHTVDTPPVGSPREDPPNKCTVDVMDKSSNEFTPNKLDLRTISGLAGLIRAPPGLDLPARN